MTQLDPQMTDAIGRGWTAPHLFASHVSGGSWKSWRHLNFIGREVAEAIATPGGGRLIVNVGPRWGKSELISHWTPAWYLSLFRGDKRVLLATAAGLARYYGGRVRDLLGEHRELGIILKEDTTAKNEWSTPKGGGMKSVTVGESVMGRGANLFVLDDPYGSWEDARSLAYRQELERWFTATANSRLEPGATVIVLHHRMHRNDLTDYILSGEDGQRWKHVSLPSLAVEDHDCLGRMKGESLCPERYSSVELDAKRTAARWSWEPMHQQNPHGAMIGAIYPQFSPMTHVRPCKDKVGRVAVGVDYGVNHPFSAHRGVLVDDVLYITDERFKSGLTERPMLDAVSSISKGAEAILIDPSAAGLKAAAFKDGMNVKDAKNDVEAGILEFGQRLADGRLFIDPSCTNLIRQIQSYEWANHISKDVPIKDDDDACDSARYLTMHFSSGYTFFAGVAGGETTRTDKWDDW